MHRCLQENDDGKKILIINPNKQEAVHENEQLLVYCNLLISKKMQPE